MSDQRANPLQEYAAATGIVSATAVLGMLLRDHFAIIDVAMLFLLAVVVVASRYSRGPALLASTLSTACFDFLFVPPYYTFGVHDTAYLLTFAMMFIVALVMSRLTASAREQGAAARTREQRIAALHAMNEELSAAAFDDVAEIIQRHVFNAAGGVVSVVLDEQASESEAWEDDALVFPLQTPLQHFGLMKVRTPDLTHPMSPDERHVLELLANQASLALERLALARQHEAARIAIEAERLRTALLSSLSHDLRTPLGTIEGAATTLVDDAANLSTDARRNLGQAIVEEVRRMARLVSNLLDMMRLETGVLAVHRSWQPLEESLGVALIRLDDRLRGRSVAINLPADLPLICVDEILLEQVFVNLLENAIKYTPPATPIDISAWLENFEVVVEVADHGPGVPVGEELAVFHKFHRATVGAAHNPATGSGLGLTICQGIITAHGGRIWVMAREGGGAVFRFALPLEEPPPLGDH